MCGERREGRQKNGLIRRRNASHGCHFVLLSPLAFSWHYFQWVLQHAFSKNSSHCTLQDAAKVEKTRPASCVPCQVKCLCTSPHSTPDLCFLSSPMSTWSFVPVSHSYYWALCLKPCGLSLSQGLLWISPTPKTLMLNRSRRVLGERKKIIHWMKCFIE